MLSIFLAARLMVSYSHRYDPNVDSTFGVLASVLPPPLGEQVQKTLAWMQGLPKNESYLRTMAKLAEAWTSLHRVRIVSLPAGGEGHRAYHRAPFHRTGNGWAFQLRPSFNHLDSEPGTGTITGGRPLSS